jgi:pimeloyl-ACP methyl ester carboxylesterase
MPTDYFRPKTPTAAQSSQDLTHLIYGTALDNSLWPEMILRVYEEFERLDPDLLGASDDFRDLQMHFTRGLQISENLVELNESNDVQRRLLNTLAVRAWLFDAGGQMVHGSDQSTALGQREKDIPLDYALPKSVMNAQQRNGQLAILGDAGAVRVLLGPDQLHGLGLPRRVQWAVFELEQDAAATANNIAGSYQLTPSRQRFLEAFIRTANLQQAAKDISVTHETARTYLKDICYRLGVNGQAGLIKAIYMNPVSLLSADLQTPSVQPLRRKITAQGGWQIEYFALGAEDAYPIIHFDALTGGALDILEFPDRYLPILDRLGARLIIPCRPGTFRSDFRTQQSARDYAQDVLQICEQLGIERFSILAYSYGSVSALGTAFELQDRIDRVVLASVCNPNYIASDWRSMDFFYQVSRVIGQKWPGLLRRVIPFLCKSILQNIDNFSDRAAARAHCAHEEALLMTPMIRERSRAMLEERIAQGMDGLVQEYQIIAKKFDFDLAELKVPLHLFHGDCDRINPLGGAEALAQAAPEATLTTLSDRGHAFIYAEWDWLLEAAMGMPYAIPAATRRGILTKA